MNLKIFIGKLAEAFGTQLTPGRVATYCEALAELQGRDLDALYRAILRTSSRFPSVKEVFDAAETNETGGTLIANKIHEAVGRFGWNNAQEAAQWLGPQCWNIVQRLGGWPYLCENMNARNVHMFVAQTRDLVKEVDYTEKTDIDSPPQLENNKVAQLASSAAKEWPE